MTRADLIKELKLDEKQFKDTLDQVEVAIAHVDLDGQFIKVNKCFCDITGYSEQEILKSTYHDITYSDDIYTQYQIRKRILDGEDSRYKTEKRYIKKDDSIIWVSLTETLIRESDGEPHYFISIIDDITDRKKAEEDVSKLTHAISDNIPLLEDVSKGQDGLTDRLCSIKMAADDGVELSRSMLDFARTTEDTTGYSSCDIRDLIKQSIDSTMPKWRNMAKAKGINYHLKSSAVCEVPAILCNPTKLRLVFVNIINNALDAMPEGGTIGFCTWFSGDTVFVTISDTGEGMTEEVMKYVFDPFITTKDFLGSGLGMSTAYGIITGHGGKMEVESEIGKGSIFSIQLPVSTEVDCAERSLGREQK